MARDHHKEEFDPKDLLLSVVRVADHAWKKMGIGLEEDGSIVLAAEPETNLLGLSETALAELEVKPEDSLSLADGV